MLLWKLKAPADGVVVAPDERLPWPQTIALGAQHVVAMFGATVLAPLLMGFDPNVAVLMSGVGTMVSGGVGGTGVTTYAENIGVMSATRIYSTALFVVAALFAIVLGFSPKFGAVIHTIPLAVMGGISIVVFGLIAIAGARIWVDNRVDFNDSRNLIVAAITLVLGTGDFTLKFGDFAMGGIGTATFGAIILNAVLSAGRR